MGVAGLLVVILLVLVFGAPLVCGGAVVAGAGIVSILASPGFWAIVAVTVAAGIAGRVVRARAAGAREYADRLATDETPGEVARREAIANVRRLQRQRAAEAREAEEEREREALYRECPHCAEQILRRAKVCKHCGRDVPADVGEGGDG